MRTETVVKEPDSVKRARKKCFERFVELGLPKKQRDLVEKAAAEKVTSVDQNLLAKLILPECQNSYIVFINGQFCKEHSEYPGCTILSLEEAFRTYGTLLVNSMNKAVVESTSSLELLNLAMSREGVCILLAPKYVSTAPLQIISIIDASDSSMMPRVHLFAGSSSQLTVIQTKEVIKADGCFYNQLIDVQCEENSRIVFEEVRQKVRQKVRQQVQSGQNFTSFEQIRATLKRSSLFRSTFVTNASGANRDIQVALCGEGAEAHANGAWLLDNQSEISTKVNMDHFEPHCRSMQLFKGVLQDSAASNFDGKIHVRKKAQKTESYQLNKNLLLSDGAKATSTPNLEIFADDVKASHGATIGKLDPEHLFYLTSRGISQMQAKAFLVHGFCEEVVAKLTTRSLQDKAYETIIPIKKHDK